MTYPARLQQLLDEGRAVIRGMIRAEFGTGTYPFWNGNYDLPWNGHVYRPNQLIEVNEPSEGMGMAASTFEIKIPAAPELGVTSDQLSLIHEEDYKGRPIFVLEAYFDPDTRALLHVEPLREGMVDTIEERGQGEEAHLLINVVSGYANHRDGYRSASHEDQQLVSPGDMFFEHAGRVKTEQFNIKF